MQTMRRLLLMLFMLPALLGPAGCAFLAGAATGAAATEAEEEVDDGD